jgi:hypothetical protein
MTLTTAENNSATGSVTLANQGPNDLTLSVTRGTSAPNECTITPTDTTLEAQRQQKITLTFAADCDPHRIEGVRFIVTLTDPKTSDRQSFDLKANPPKQPNPDWAKVGIGYLLVAAVALALLLVCYWTWGSPSSGQSKGAKR